ncbi:MAG TPA: DUF2721 domain-containing protein, partial [Planctomycetota bacterium]|nr:DUF2721 domain-containing protein [Planctomycetota bacterium]
MASVPDALSVLSAMITPAVLISACGSLILVTSTRLMRAVDRVRDVSLRFAELGEHPPEGQSVEEERKMLFGQLDLTTTRARLLQRALARLYWALGAFVGASAAIGLVAASGRQYTWVPIGFGLAGAGLLLYASVLLVHESRIALAALEAEMDFVWQQGKSRAS